MTPHKSLFLPGIALLALTGHSAAQETDGSGEVAAVAEPQVVKIVNMRGSYADLAEQSFDLASVLMGGGSKPKSFYDLVDQLARLETDDSGDTVLFDLSQSVGLNQAQMAEVERCMTKLRKAKRCIAYLESAGNTQLAIASQCDQILMADMGSLDIGSLAMSTTYMKDALDMLGIQMDVVRCGDFKGAVEPYMQSHMSAHLKDHYLDMLRAMNSDVVRRVASGRGLAAERVRQLQGQRVFTAKEALVEGLVDRLVPWQGAEKSLEELLGDDEIAFVKALKKKKRKSFNLMAIMQNMFKPQEEEEVEDATLAVLHLSGTIVDGISDAPGMIVSRPMVKHIRGLTENDNVKGVVVRINSPGGSATASEAIVLALAELAKKKPVVFSMGQVAASGGYYVTCIGRPILAEAGTITGSIGVFGMKPNMGPLMRRIGVNEQIIALDESAAMWSTNHAWTEAEKERMQVSVDEIYDRFLNHVAKSRDMGRDEVEAIAGGRVWSGGQAVARGLVDRIGGLDEAIAMLADNPDDFEIVHMPRPANFMDTFAEELLDVRAMLSSVGGISDLVLRRLEGVRGPLALLLDAMSERPTRVWAMMPAELTVK